MIKTQIQRECINHYYLIHMHLKCRKPIDHYECLSLAVFSDQDVGFRTVSVSYCKYHLHMLQT